MTVAEIVSRLLYSECQKETFRPWSYDDYEKGWLVIQLVEEREGKGCLIDFALVSFDLLASDYAEIERRVTEWEKGKEE